MLLDIIKKELLDNITSPKFYITYLLCFVLIIIAFITGINDYKSDLKEYNAGVSLNRETIDNATLESFPTSISIFKRPAVLSAIVRGIEGNLGRVTNVAGLTPVSTEFQKPKFTTNPIFSIFGPLDLDFIVRIVMSLFVILFTYDAISGEKERGTLKLIMSNKVPRDILILGKSIGSFLSILVPFFIPFLIGIIIFSLYPDISITGDNWIRILLLLVSYLLYLLMFFTLGLMVSCKTNRSSVSFLVLLFIWVIFVTVIPKSSVMISRQLYSIPSSHEITYQKSEVRKEAFRNYQNKAMNYSKENPIKEGESREEYMDRFMKNYQDQLEITNKEIERKNKQIDEEYESKKKYQRLLAMYISRISPASTLRYSSMNIAQTGIESHERLVNSVNSFQVPFSKYVTSRFYENQKQRIANMNNPDKNTAKLDLSDIPRFEYKEESVTESLSNIVLDFGILIFYSILFFVLSYLSFMKYDVR
ncbi:ABC transporter permease subunit [candidate division KSB1 bacterium]